MWRTRRWWWFGKGVGPGARCGFWLLAVEDNISFVFGFIIIIIVVVVLALVVISDVRGVQGGNKLIRADCYFFLRWEV